MSDIPPEAPPGTRAVNRELPVEQLTEIAKPFFEAADALRSAGHDRITVVAALQFAAGAMMANAHIFIASDPASIAAAVLPLMSGYNIGRAMMDEEAKARSH